MEVMLLAEIREALGTGPSRLLRRNNRVPAVIYGNQEKTKAISINNKDLNKLYKERGFMSRIITIKVRDEVLKVLPHAVSLNPLQDKINHVDFILLGNKIQKLKIPIKYEGKDKAIGVKRGGFFNFVKREVLIQCDINRIPESIVINVLNLCVGQSIKAMDLLLPVGSMLLEDPNLIIASIVGRSSKVDTEESTVQSTNVAPATT